MKRGWTALVTAFAIAVSAAWVEAARAQEGGGVPAAASKDEAQQQREIIAGLWEEANAARTSLEKLWGEAEAAREALGKADESTREAAQKTFDTRLEAARDAARELQALVGSLDREGEDVRALRRTVAQVLGEESRPAEPQKSLADLRQEASSLSLSDLRKRLAIAESLYRAALEDRKRAQAAVAGATESDAEAARKQLDEARAAATRRADELQVVLSELRGRGQGGERVAALETLLNREEGLSHERMSTGAVIGIVQGWVDNLRTWVIDNGPKIIFKTLLFIVILLVFRMLAGIAGRITERALSSAKLQLSVLLRNFTVGLVRKLIIVLGLMIAVAEIGIDIGPLLAGVGVVGFIVGFALQDTLSNFASGVMLLIYRPYDEGDFVEAAGMTGKVETMNLVSTSILTPDNQLVIVPNNKIWGGIIRNVTARKERRVDLTFGIGYDDDIEKAERVLHEVVEGHEKVLSAPAPMIRLHELADSSVNFVVRPWVKASDYWDVKCDLTRTVKLRFDEEGISIPYPQTDIHVHQVAPAAT